MKTMRDTSGLPPLSRQRAQRKAGSGHVKGRSPGQAFRRFFRLLPARAAKRELLLDAAKRAPLRKVLDQAAGDPALGYYRRQRVVLVATFRPALLVHFLLRGPDQPIGRQLEARVGVGCALLDLDGPGARHAEREVALGRLAAISVLAAHLDAQLGSLVIVEPAQRPDHVLLREPPHSLGDAHLLALHDELHAATVHTASRRRTALTVRVSRVR